MGFREGDIERDCGWASDQEYIEHIRKINADTPADRRLYEASGCAGKLAVFAARLDTFPAGEKTSVFYIGTNKASELTDSPAHPSRIRAAPNSAEYVHRGAFDIAERYGKDTFLLIRWLGTERLPTFFALRSRLDEWSRFSFVPAHLSDRVLQFLSRLFPRHLPKRMTDFRDRYEHHLLLKVPGDGIEEARLS